MKQVLKLNCMKNKTAIITGGATGLGKKMAEHYAANDVNTIICSRNLERLEKTTNEINWVNGYHKRVRNILTPSMNSNERDWLINQTAPLQ